MQDTEIQQQVLRLLYHEHFDLTGPCLTDLSAWGRTEDIDKTALCQIFTSLTERGLVRGETFHACSLTARGVFYVEDSGLAPQSSATHQFAVRFALLGALSRYAAGWGAVGNADDLAEQAAVPAVDCRKNLPVLQDEGWARVSEDGAIAITIKGLQTWQGWRRDLEASVAGDRRLG